MPAERGAARDADHYQGSPVDVAVCTIGPIVECHIECSCTMDNLAY